MHELVLVKQAQEILAVIPEPATLAAADRTAIMQPLGQVVAAALQAAARSDGTRRAYTTSIGYFLRYLEGVAGQRVPISWRPFAQAGREQHKSPRGRTVTTTMWAYNGPAAVLRLVEPGTVDGFRAWREAEGDNPNTASKHVAAVRTFLSVAYRDHVLSTEQATRIGLKPYRQRQSRDKKPVGRRLTREEARQLRGAIDTETNKGLRDRAILDLGLYGAMRAQELASLSPADFVQDTGRWWVQFAGKGSKTRRFSLAMPAYLSVVAWVAVCGVELGKDERPLFCSVNKGDGIGRQGINTSTIGRLVAEYGAKADLAPATGKNRLSPHDLRRTAARNAYDNGAPLLLVQRWLGHADPSTTAHYIGLEDGNGQSAVDFVAY